MLDILSGNALIVHVVVALVLAGLISVLVNTTDKSKKKDRFPEIKPDDNYKPIKVWRKKTVKGNIYRFIKGIKKRRGV